MEVDDLRMAYGATTAVDGLSLTVARGSITAVLGPNGAGKTTTLETCEGYRKPQSGTVRVLGLDPQAQRRDLLPRIGVMLQSGGAWSGVRAVEMLRHVATLHAHPLDVPMLVERLGLGSCGRTPYRRLSGGQQQRLALAMAVVGRPELVFVDEPTAGMDPQARRTTWELLDELRRDGVTIVLTTHYMDEAERLADQVHVIDQGRLIASGSPYELTRGTGSSTIRLVVTEPFPPQAPASLQATLGRGHRGACGQRAQPADHRAGRRQHAGQGLGLVRRPRRAAGVADARPAHARGRVPADHRTGAGAVSAGTDRPDGDLHAPARRRTAAPDGARAGPDGDPAAAPQRRAAAAGGRGPADRARRRDHRGPALRPDLLATARSTPSPPGVLALAVMSTSFTSLAIATGFERRYGVLKRLGSSPLPRSGLLAGKVGALLVVEMLQFVVIGTAAAVLGWSPALSPVGLLGALLCTLLGTAAFASLGLFVAGALRAEATLAAANLVYLLLLAGGAVVFPTDSYGPAAGVLALLPSGALGTGMRTSLIHASLPVVPLLVLAAWTAVGTALTARTFRWE